MDQFKSILQIVNYAEKQAITISEAILNQQSRDLNIDSDEIKLKMRQRLILMQQGILAGLEDGSKSLSGLSGGNALLLKQSFQAGRLAVEKLYAEIMIKSMALSEYNAAMGRIVACPTAGSCGIVPGVLITLMEEYKFCEERVVMSLINAAGIGLIIATNSYISGAQGGCQAECGSAAAMAASAAVELMGGTPRMSANACAIALKTMLGLVCDPVAGLVEVPCIKRNVSGAVNAFTAANMALAGIESVIPADEVILAMKQIGECMCSTLKETALGGLACSQTAKDIEEQLKKRSILTAL